MEGGHVRTINVGVIGVGNCASSLVQGVEYYSNSARRRAGLTNAVCAGYAVSDVRFTSAFDVDASKIGLDLSGAIWVAPNNALKFADVPHLGVPVLDGILGDGVGHTRRTGSTRVATPRSTRSSST
jgi:myo-inositol-1-phosphate synthase